MKMDVEFMTIGEAKEEIDLDCKFCQQQLKIAEKLVKSYKVIVIVADSHIIGLKLLRR